MVSIPEVLVEDVGYAIQFLVQVGSPISNATMRFWNCEPLEW
jgi:hypothetical protein